MGIAPVNLKVLGNVSFIVLGVVVASFGELQFVMVGFLFQVAGIVFEATRLVMVERILSSKEFKMDPLVSLYYYAPACAVMNTLVLIFTELPKLTMNDIHRVGGMTLFANAGVAFLLNVSVVFLVCLITVPYNMRRTNIHADRQDLVSGPHSLRRSEGHSPRSRIHVPLPRPRYPAPGFRLQHCARWSYLLQARWREAEGGSQRRQHEVGGVRSDSPRAPQADGLRRRHRLDVLDPRQPWSPLRP